MFEISHNIKIIFKKNDYMTISRNELVYFQGLVGSREQR